MGVSQDIGTVLRSAFMRLLPDTSDPRDGHALRVGHLQAHGLVRWALGDKRVVVHVLHKLGQRTDGGQALSQAGWVG